ncbi:MAG: hypothetical protein ACK42L_01065 [Thermoanaerobaculum sp.]
MESAVQKAASERFREEIGFSGTKNGDTVKNAFGASFRSVKAFKDVNHIAAAGGTSSKDSPYTLESEAPAGKAPVLHIVG